jgi:hypothetical protein
MQKKLKFFLDVRNLVYICSRNITFKVFISMEKNITIESIRNKSYEEMSREEKQFFCENAHLLCEDTQEDNGIIIVDDIDSYIGKRNLLNVSELENIYTN